MPRRLPQLSALRAFEAAARHVSFTRAAEELCVTQGAVSHQVKALESDLGIKFFNRERQRLTITAAGQEYLAVVRDALCAMDQPISPLSGLSTGSAGLPRFIRRSTFGCRPRCTTSTSHARTSTLRSVMETAIGQDCT